MFRKVGMMFASVLAALSMTGCPAHTPVQVALDSGKPELVALAVAGSYAITQGVILSIAKDPTTSHDVQQKLIALDEKAYPTVKKLKPAAYLVEKIRADLAAGTTDQERLQIALNNLNDYLNAAAPLIKDVNDAVEANKKEQP